jgi:iron complex outermembrane receptor protein
MPTANSNQYSTDPRTYSDTKEFGGSVRGEFTFDAGELTTISAVTDSSNTYFYDGDSSPANIFDGYQPHNTGDYFTQELDFVSRNFGPVSVSVGAFYLNGNEESGSNTQPVTEGFRSVVTLMPLPPSPLPPSFDTVNKVSKEIFAGYGQLVYRITDKLILTAGGRYSSETQHGYTSKFPGDPNPLQVVERPGGPVTFDSFTPSATLRYELTPKSNVYFSYNQGFKSGIIDTAAITQAPVRPETITAYEVGYKGHLLPNLSIDASIFHYDYKNMQFVIFEPLSGLYEDQNAASSRIQGADFNAVWTATPTFTLTANLAFLDAKFVKFPGAQIFVPSVFPTAGGNLLIGDNAATADLSGHQMPRAPKTTGTIAGDYHLDTDMGRFAAYGSIYYNSGFGFEVSNRLWQSAYTTVNAEVSFAPNAIRGLRLVLWGKNLGDKAYLASVLDDQLTDAGAYAEPRTFGVRAEYAF